MLVRLWTNQTNVIVQNASGRQGLFRLATFWCFPGADDRGSDGSICLDLQLEEFNLFLYRTAHRGTSQFSQERQKQDLVRMLSTGS